MAFDIKKRSVPTTGCFDTLDPPPQPIWALIHIKMVYFHDPTSIPDYHASFQNYSSIDQLPVSWFMCQSQAHFHEQFQAEFMGWHSKNGHKIVNN